MRPSLFFLIFIIGALSATGQQAGSKLSLQQCIEMAVTNNIQAKQGTSQVERAKVGYDQSKANLLPSLNSSINHGINEGRSIDPFTNGYVNQQINYASYGIGSSLILFNGSNLQKTIRSNAYALDASKMELQQVRDNLTINTMLAYLQVLNNEDQVELAKAQVLVVQKQLERLEVLNKQGAISPPLVHELTGQLKNNELSVIMAKNALESANEYSLCY
jgi:outer membrane protein